MKKLKVLTLLLLVSGFAFGQTTVKVIKWSELEEYLAQDSEKVRVINFWATWCGPCVKELPYFQEAHETYGEKGVEIVLVSLDDVEVVEDRVNPFIDRKGLTASVVLLDETDYNMFIPKVDERWSGAIPMTLILDNDSQKRTFFERELDREELFESISAYID